MSIDAILTGQLKSYTKAEEDAFLAAKAKKTDFIYTESSTSATNAYRAGEYFYWTDGAIYRALENIASGATLISLPTSSANCKQVDSNGALNSTQNSKVNKTDFVYIESSTSATRDYRAGEYFYWTDGTIYRALENITTGDTLTANANCKQVGVNGALNSAQNSKVDKSNLAIMNSWASTATNNYQTGEYFYWNGLLYKAITNITYGTTLTDLNCELINNGGLNEPLMRGSWSCILLIPRKENNVNGSAYIDFSSGDLGILISMGNVSSAYGVWLVLVTPSTVNLVPVLSPSTGGITFTKSVLRVTFTNPTAVNVRLYYCSLAPTFTLWPDIN